MSLYNSSIKAVQDDCSECGRWNYLAHKAKKLCQYCNEKRKREEKKAKGKTPYRYNKKPTGERALFMAIWASRPHRCEHCGLHLTEPRVHYFAHVKSKGSDPAQRLNPANIRIYCFDFGNSSNGCHYLFDSGSKEDFEKRRDLFKDKLSPSQTSSKAL